MVTSDGSGGRRARKLCRQEFQRSRCIYSVYYLAASGAVQCCEICRVGNDCVRKGYPQRVSLGLDDADAIKGRPQENGLSGGRVFAI